MSDQIEKSDPERVDECEDRRLPFSLADSRALIVWEGERENDRSGMSRVEVGDGMMTVGWASDGPLTFLDPENDPLGTGYHIIQSKIAIGSGGVFGKGYLQGTQSHLEFLPEHATDFIFAVCGEEFGLIGSVLLILCFNK